MVHLSYYVFSLQTYSFFLILHYISVLSLILLKEHLLEYFKCLQNIILITYTIMYNVI